MAVVRIEEDALVTLISASEQVLSITRNTEKWAGLYNDVYVAVKQANAALGLSPMHALEPYPYPHKYGPTASMNGHVHNANSH